MPSSLFKLSELFELFAAKTTKKPRVVRFNDGVVINGEFGTKEVEDLIKKELGGKKLPLIYGDPPYGVLDKSDADWDQGITSKHYIDWTKEALKFMAPGASLYWWGGIGKRKDRVFFEFLATAEKETGMQLRNLITWAKRRAYGKKDDYLFTREELAWLVNGDKPRTFNVPYLDKERGYAGFNKDYPAKSKFLRRTNVWTDINELFSGKIHIAQKPEKLAMIAIECHTRKNEYVLDPFAGSGSTGMAARRLGRKYILIERDPKNYDMIIERMKRSLPEKTATLLERANSFYTAIQTA